MIKIINDTEDLFVTTAKSINIITQMLDKMSDLVTIHEERIEELEKQVEALRRPLKNYQEQKTFKFLWRK